MKLLKNESGMTLIEVMITGTIMMVMMMGMTSFIRMLQKNNQAQETKGNVIQMQNAVRGTAGNSNAIQTSMGETN